MYQPLVTLLQRYPTLTCSGFQTTAQTNAIDGFNVGNIQRLLQEIPLVWTSHATETNSACSLTAEIEKFREGFVLNPVTGEYMKPSASNTTKHGSRYYRSRNTFPKSEPTSCSNGDFIAAMLLLGFQMKSEGVFLCTTVGEAYGQEQRSNSHFAQWCRDYADIEDVDVSTNYLITDNLTIDAYPWTGTFDTQRKFLLEFSPYLDDSFRDAFEQVVQVYNDRFPKNVFRSENQMDLRREND